MCKNACLSILRIKYNYRRSSKIDLKKNKKKSVARPVGQKMARNGKKVDLLS